MRPSPSRGFTLFELLIVLSIIALAATLVVPTLSGNDSQAFQAQVRQAEAALNYARRTAIARGSPTVATFRYSDPNALLPAEQAGGRETRGLAIPSWESDDIAIRFRSGPDDNSEPREQVEIIFFPEGGSTGGILHFEQDGLRATLTIEPITGRVSRRFGDDDPS